MLHWQDSAARGECERERPEIGVNGGCRCTGVLAAFIVISAASIRVVEGNVQQKEERMKKMCLVLCLVCLVSSVALAQGKTNVQWKCDKPSVQHNIPVGDKPGDAYAIEQINCTAIKGDIAGNKMKSGIGTEFLYLKGDDVTGHGEFVESMENGDKNVYKYEFSGTTKNGAFESGTNKWSLIEGGGKMKGGKANGTCKAKANPDQSTSFDCMGTYTPATI